MAKRTSYGEIKQYANRRAQGLILQRYSYDPIMRDLTNNITPEIGRSLWTDLSSQTQIQGIRHDAFILNSLPTTCAMTLAAGMQAGITSPASPWFRITVPNDWLYENAAVRNWLDFVQDAMRRVFAGSNLYRVFHESYLHAGVFGTSCAILRGDAERVVHGTMLDQGAFWIAENERGQVDTCYRRFAMTARQLEEEFGKENLPKNIQDMLGNVKEGNRGDDVFFNVECLIEPNSNALDIPEANGKPWRSIYWIGKGAGYDEKEGVISIRHYSGNPIFCLRWATSPGLGWYGYGPGRMCLGDCIQLQEMESDKLKAIRKVVDPPMLAPDTMKGTMIRSAPGSITFYSQAGVTASGTAVKPLLDIKPDLQAMMEAINITSGHIKEMFFYDLFKMFSDMDYKQPPTAQEIIEKKQEKLINLGPVVESCTNELDGVINRVFQLMWEQGLVPPPPPELMQRYKAGSGKIPGSFNLKIEIVSPLATAQRLIGLQGMQQFTGYVQQLAQTKPEVLDKIDADAMVDVAAGSLGTPAKIIVDDALVAKRRGARLKAQQQQQQAQQMQATTQSAKNLGQAKTGSDSTALGDLRDQYMGMNP